MARKRRVTMAIDRKAVTGPCVETKEPCAAGKSRRLTMKIVRGNTRSKMRRERSMYGYAASGRRTEILNPQDNPELLKVNHSNV